MTRSTIVRGRPLCHPRPRRYCRSAPLTGNPARVPRRASTSQQGAALPGGPTHSGGDHRRDARRGRRCRGVRLRGLIVVLWRAGLRVSEALALAESDLDPSRGAILVRHGKGGKRREVGMDRWAWDQLAAWLTLRSELHAAAARAGVRRRFAPHQLRHAHALGMSREGVPLLVIQRQLGHADLAITSVYLRGIDNTEIVHTVHERPAPMAPA